MIGASLPPRRDRAVFSPRSSSRRGRRELSPGPRVKPRLSSRRGRPESRRSLLVRRSPSRAGRPVEVRRSPSRAGRPLEGRLEPPAERALSRVGRASSRRGRLELRDSPSRVERLEVGRSLDGRLELARPEPPEPGRPDDGRLPAGRPELGRPEPEREPLEERPDELEPELPRPLDRPEGRDDELPAGILLLLKI